MTWLLDCDGVVWVGDRAIRGAAQAVGALRASGTRVVFLTNNSYPRRSEHLAKLERFGMASDEADLLSSAMAVTRLVHEGERALVLGGPGVLEELQACGVTTLNPYEDGDFSGVDVVVVGINPAFDYRVLSVAATALQAGARLVASNDDATVPSPNGQLPGAGSLLAAVACAGQATPEIAGKPYDATVALVRERVGPVEMVVGDRASTDGLLARRLGSPFALVLSGVTGPDQGVPDPRPDVVAPDLADVVRGRLRNGSRGER
jgi:4-nitrophenyl phosphatase